LNVSESTNNFEKDKYKSYCFHHAEVSEIPSQEKSWLVVIPVSLSQDCHWVELEPVSILNFDDETPWLEDYDHDINYIGPNVFKLKYILDSFVALAVNKNGIAGIYH